MYYTLPIEVTLELQILVAFTSLATLVLGYLYLFAKPATAPLPMALDTSKLRVFTSADLAPYKGANGGPILVAVDGIVFDFSTHATGPAFYGPGGGYSVFAGCDATFGLATMNLTPASWPTVAEFTDAQNETLGQWVGKFIEKYTIRGTCSEGLRPTTLAQLRERVPKLAAVE